MANEVLCWGKSEEIKEQFGSDLQSVTERDLPSDFTSSENLYVKGFLGEALCSAIARVRPLLYRRLRSYAYLIVDSHDKERKALAHLSEVMGKTWGVGSTPEEHEATEE